MCPNRPILTSGTQSYCRPNSVICFFYSKVDLQSNYPFTKEEHEINCPLALNFPAFQTRAFLLPEKWLPEVPSTCIFQKTKQKKGSRFYIFRTITWEWKKKPIKERSCSCAHRLKQDYDDRDQMSPARTMWSQTKRSLLAIPYSCKVLTAEKCASKRKAHVIKKL